MAMQYMVKPKDGNVFKVMVHGDRLAPQIPENRDVAIYNQMRHLGQGSTYVMRVHERIQEFNIYRLPYHGDIDSDTGQVTEPGLLSVDVLSAIAKCIDFEQKLPQLENMVALS